jgi:hypothetical protein
VTTLRSPSRDQQGQASVIIIGFAVVLAMAVALVVDVSAAYLQRSGLDSLADGAALQAADLGATGADVYEGGVPTGRLVQTPAQARAAVATYLAGAGAFSSYPGLTYDVDVDLVAQRVRVTLRAPLDLPLQVPGSPQRTSIGAVGAAVTAVD